MILPTWLELLEMVVWMFRGPFVGSRSRRVVAVAFCHADIGVTRPCSGVSESRETWKTVSNRCTSNRFFRFDRARNELLFEAKIYF